MIGSKVIVFTDHTSSKYLFNKYDSKPRLIRWVLLLGIWFGVKDKKDCENNVGDHLSRLVKYEVTKHEAEVLAEFQDDSACY